MKNSRLLLVLLFPFFFFLFSHFVVVVRCQFVGAMPLILDVDISLDCGLQYPNRTDPDGRHWIGDVDTEFRPLEPTNVSPSTIATAPSNVPDNDDEVYNTVRLSRSPFTYSFPVVASDARKDLIPIFIRLYFLPVTYGEYTKSNASFTVKTGRFTLLNFSGDSYDEESVYREFCVSIRKSQKLVNITFIPSWNSYAFINGIQVISMALNIYDFRNDTAMELYHRLNIGGEEILSYQDDFDMSRKWIKDTLNDVGISINDFSFSIDYNSTDVRTAPNKVFRSAVSLYGGSLSNFTWGYSVHGGFEYLVRLHFCPFQKQIFEKNKMHFIVYLNHKKVENGNVDLVNLYYPVKKDFVIMIDEDVNDLNITICLPPKPNVSYAILNGIEVFKLSNNSNLAVSQKPAPAPPSPPGITPAASAKKSRKVTVIVSAVCSSVGFAILFSLAGFMIFWKLGKKKKPEGFLLPQQGCRSFSFRELAAATDYFNKKREVGAGGFGAVYKGVLKDEDLTVAVKRLKPESRQGEQEFKTEIELLSKLHHYHIVSLIGYCFVEDKEMLLVYEFMENGTFKDHLYETTNPPLPWKTRLQICYEAARGLNYLHTGLDKTIIHRDVKTTNILLDQNWAAKVSDLGISKIGQKNCAAMSTAVKGTGGYMDPEYYTRFQVTEKSDVYSFGVVLFEVLCARKPLDQTLGEERFNLTAWAKNCMEKGTVLEIIDQNLKGKISPECLKLYLELATSCINSHTKDRPAMVVVEDKLRRIIEFQEEADAEKMKKNPDGEYCYSEELLFSLIPSMAEASLHSESYKIHMSNVVSASGTEFTTSTMKSEDPCTSTTASN